jgi:hypothetical protein
MAENKYLNAFEIKEKFFYSNIRDKENNYLIFVSNHKKILHSIKK